MSWNYRVVRHRNGSVAIHEVYYDEAGKPTACTESPVCFASEGKEAIDDILLALELARRNVEKLPILNIDMFEGSVKEKSSTEVK